MLTVEFSGSTNRFVPNDDFLQQGSRNLFNKMCFLDTGKQRSLIKSLLEKNEMAPSSVNAAGGGHNIGFMIVDVGIIFESVFETRPCSNMRREFIGDQWQGRILTDIMEICEPDTIYYGCLERYRKLILIMVDWTRRFESEECASEALRSSFSRDKELSSVRNIIHVHDLQSFPIRDYSDAMNFLEKVIDKEIPQARTCSHYHDCIHKNCFSEEEYD